LQTSACYVISSAVSLRAIGCIALLFASQSCTPLKDDVGGDAGLDAGSAVDAGSRDVARPDAMVPDATPPDATTSDAAEAGVDAGAVCAADAVDFYVRVGTACSFPSITAAIAAARRSTAPARTIHVAPGLYDDSVETFPLDLRDGISLVGTSDSPETTVIKGTHLLDHTLEGGSTAVGPTPSVTIVTGAVSTVSRVANIRINSGGESGERTFGIFCDRGNAAPYGTPQPPPNLIVDNMVFDNGFGGGVTAGTSSTPRAGCNLRVTRSLFKGSPSQRSWICVETSSCDSIKDPPGMAIEVGDGDPKNGNTFIGIGKGDKTTGAVFVESCSSSVLVHGNTFTGGESGVAIIDSGSRGHYVITDNIFQNHEIGGIRFETIANTPSVIDEISRNQFTGCAYAAIWVDWGASSILRARGNAFVGNDNGVVIGNDGKGITGVFDFGAPNDDGGNDFRCNGGAITTTSRGADLRIDADVTGSGRITAYGNKWDHDPPSVSGTLVNGEDVVAAARSVPNVGNAQSSTLQCPVYHVTGP